MPNNFLSAFRNVQKDFLLLPFNISLYCVSRDSNAILVFPIVIPIGLMIYATKHLLNDRKNAQRITLYVILLMILVLFLVQPIIGNFSPIIYYGPFILLSTVVGEYELFITQVILFLGFIIFLASTNLLVLAKKLRISKKLNYAKLVAILFLLIISIGYASVLPVPNWSNQNFPKTVNIKSSVGTITISYRVSVPPAFDRDKHTQIGISFSIDKVISNNPFVVNVRLAGIRLEQLNSSHNNIIVNHVEVYGFSLTVPGDLLESGFSVRISLTIEVVTLLAPYYEAHSIEISING